MEELFQMPEGRTGQLASIFSNTAGRSLMDACAEVLSVENTLYFPFKKRKGSVIIFAFFRKIKIHFFGLPNESGR